MSPPPAGPAGKGRGGRRFLPAPGPLATLLVLLICAAVLWLAYKLPSLS